MRGPFPALYLMFCAVVGVTIPSEKVTDFAQEYFSLFSAYGDRPDIGDRGPEYRSLIGG
jgi:hypothetical protein